MKKEQVIYENHFDLHYINKFASVMALGNGYFGLRASTEEDYADQTRGMYVAGIYNKAASNEPSDLVNLPDIVGMKIEIDNEIFSLLEGKILSYHRELHLDRGELKREFIWKNNDGDRFHFIFQRLVAKHHLHLLASKVTITSLDKPAKLKIVSGINAQQTNFGRQHLIEEKVRVYDEKVMQGIYQTTESDHTVVITTSCKNLHDSHVSFAAKNRQLNTTIKHDLPVDTPYVLEKFGTVYTSLDRDQSIHTLEEDSIKEMIKVSSRSYDEILAESVNSWMEFWQQKRVNVTSKNPFDQLAIDFALYHIEVMTPAHDERFSVGAKGLTGEGYKGHVFWDTELFIAPFHLFTQPDNAKNLLNYRFRHLNEAKEKAKKNGYDGALFPWESAFSGKEETPEYAAINIKTGTRQKVASAIAEHHIVADIAHAVVEYYEATLDDDFMKHQGLSLLKETARFWISRTTEENGKLSIKNVIGPDEYTEHIDNNAYTNYLAAYNVEKALYFHEKFGDSDDSLKQKGRDFLNRLYLPKPNADLVIPQDDTFLTKPEIDLTRYKEHQGSQGILLDYSRQEINEMQILKQADLVMLLYLFPRLFPREVVMKNLHYYEEHTIHDSSLSKAIHAIVAARCDELNMAYRFFQEACLIDLGPNPHSSDEGLHAASLGAIWLAMIFGFANVSTDNGLSLDPKLPDDWSELVFPLHYQGSELEILITHQKIAVTKHTGPSISLKISGKNYLVSDKIEVNR